MTKTALITGITGQDGAYLAELLLREGYRVVGAERRASNRNRERLNELGITEALEFVDFDANEVGECRGKRHASRASELRQRPILGRLQESVLTA